MLSDNSIVDTASIQKLVPEWDILLIVDALVTAEPIDFAARRPTPPPTSGTVVVLSNVKGSRPGLLMPSVVQALRELRETHTGTIRFGDLFPLVERKIKRQNVSEPAQLPISWTTGRHDVPIGRAPGRARS